ncbi:MAG TPA: FAD:protein FMN transferase [Patescibacteria group bacterium]|nr:FAD:protein FMN transferase [Patescibacteria group bacterium]
MKPKSFTYPSMGTSWEITIWDSLNEAKLLEIKKEIISKSNIFDKTYSRFKKNSFVNKISDTKGMIETPIDFVPMLKLYFDLYDLSNKKITPLIGQTLVDMGYDADYSLIPKDKISSVPDLKETVSIIDNEHIKVRKPSLFDFGALGKGYFVDIIQNILTSHKIKKFLVNGSGDIYYKGEDILRAGLEHPFDPTKVIGVVDMKTGSMCASASNRRRWGNFHHIIDPTTLIPAVEVVAVWVVSKSAALSDALATCLFFAPPENFEDQFEFKYVILNKEMRVKKSKGFEVELF